MSNSRLQHQLEVLAAAPNSPDFLAMLEAMTDEVADIRTDIGKPDSMEIRQGIAHYLRGTVDSINRIRKNRTANRGRSQRPADEAGN